MKPKTALLDCEYGTISVRGKIESGEVEVFDATSFKTAEKSVQELFKREGEFDLIAFDTLSVFTTRLNEDLVRDRIHSTGGGGVWESRNTASVTREQWGMMTSMTCLLLRSIIDLGKRVALVCHEAERQDPTREVILRGPDLSPKMLSTVFGMCDAIVRLGRVAQETKVGDCKVPPGGRVLRLADSPHYMAKWREPDQKDFPELLAKPTWKELGLRTTGNPRVVLLYGPPGAGKTTFIASEKEQNT